MTKKKFVFRKKRLDVPRTLFNLEVCGAGCSQLVVPLKRSEKSVLSFQS